MAAKWATRASGRNVDKAMLTYWHQRGLIGAADYSRTAYGARDMVKLAVISGMRKDGVLIDDILLILPALKSALRFHDREFAFVHGKNVLRFDLAELMADAEDEIGSP